MDCTGITQAPTAPRTLADAYQGIASACQTYHGYPPQRSMEDVRVFFAVAGVASYELTMSFDNAVDAMFEETDGVPWICGGPSILGEEIIEHARDEQRKTEAALADLLERYPARNSEV